MINYFGPSWDSMPSHNDNMLKESQEQNTRLRHVVKEQENIILNLAQHHEEVTGQLEQHTARITKRIADHEREKGKLVHDLKEQTRIASALENRDTKMKKVFSDTASIMFLELEYQEELISKMAPNDGDFFQPTHEILVNLVKNIGHWTADDENSDMMFDLEDEPQFEQLYAKLLSRFDEQSYQLKIQAITLNRQKSIIDEQASTITELEAQKRKIAGNLEEQNGRLALILEYLQGNGGKGTSHLGQRMVYRTEQHGFS
ncbi:hypothetical protein N7447_000810 [Penicillium robsamsonii]|uniref:uncharacterized protein n=1 Tax=Penicillium robsamsonii TaxID=1792511 RepID=UPI0025497964|nr:uncharacterized protein N7447_000810 [Penicillium robsamsonii]KAJ5834784.1 hypothetical protein N7447_000810 [Penicillium robsamsonii]